MVEILVNQRLILHAAVEVIFEVPDVKEYITCKRIDGFAEFHLLFVAQGRFKQLRIFHHSAVPKFIHKLLVETDGERLNRLRTINSAGKARTLVENEERIGIDRQVAPPDTIIFITREHKADAEIGSGLLGEFMLALLFFNIFRYSMAF